MEFGDTHVLCTASVEDGVPPFLRGKGQGWVTAEYGMLPRSTHTRSAREAARGKQCGRTQEIQRLIGRSLRAVMDLKALGERTITIDCDVLQADGGTRTAAITGGYVALSQACEKLLRRGAIRCQPAAWTGRRDLRRHRRAAVPVLDLDYAEDSQAETDMNVVMNNGGGFVEIQGTAEGHAFRRHELDALLELADEGAAGAVRAAVTGARATAEREDSCWRAATRASCASSPRCSRPSGHELIAQIELGIDSAPETGTTFEANALLKARHAAAHAACRRWRMIRVSRWMRSVAAQASTPRATRARARAISTNLEQAAAMSCAMCRRPRARRAIAASSRWCAAAMIRSR